MEREKAPFRPFRDTVALPAAEDKKVISRCTLCVAVAAAAATAPVRAES